MAKISRQLLKLFGGSGNSSNFEQFGSAEAGSVLRTKDIPTIQALDAWLNGWQDAINPANSAPCLEDMNALMYVLCYQLASILQDGVPTWQADTTYFTGSIVHHDGTDELYMSKVDSNIGNALPSKSSNANWKYLRFGPPAGTIVQFGGGEGQIPDDYLPCDGTAVSRTTYADLFAVVGTLFGSGDGTTTFNVPDFRSRFAVGRDVRYLPFHSVGDTGGALTHTHTQATHNHSVAAHDHRLLNTGSASSPVTGGSNVEANPTKGSQLFYNATHGIGAQVTAVTNQTDTVGPVTTSDATPVIDEASNVPPFLVVVFMIKT